LLNNAATNMKLKERNENKLKKENGELNAIKS